MDAASARVARRPERWPELRLDRPDAPRFLHNQVLAPRAEVDSTRRLIGDLFECRELAPVLPTGFHAVAGPAGAGAWARAA